MIYIYLFHTNSISFKKSFCTKSVKLNEVALLKLKKMFIIIHKFVFKVNWCL